jgi:hypothetical protein
MARTYKWRAGDKTSGKASTLITKESNQEVK